MRILELLVGMAAVAFLSATISGCAVLFPEVSSAEPESVADYSSENENNLESEARLAQEELRAEDFRESGWRCVWDPTMNENWHDDILCQNGIDSDRPILLTDWDFVTQDDMMAEGQNYEAYLNNR